MDHLLSGDAEGLVPRYSVNPAPAWLARARRDDGYDMKLDALHIRYSVLRDRSVIVAPDRGQ